MRYCYQGIWMLFYYPYLPTPSLGQDMTQGQFLSGVLTGLNSEFSFSWTSCITKAKELSLPYYLPISAGRIIGFISFPRVLVLCEMQSVSSRIWTRVAVFISYDDNYYTGSTSSIIRSFQFIREMAPYCLKYIGFVFLSSWNNKF